MMSDRAPGGAQQQRPTHAHAADPPRRSRFERLLFGFVRVVVRLHAFGVVLVRLLLRSSLRNDLHHILVCERVRESAVLWRVPHARAPHEGELQDGQGEEGGFAGT